MIHGDVASGICGLARLDVRIEWTEKKKRRRARSSRLLVPLSGMSGQPDGGRLTGRVLAYLYNPGRTKKVPGKMEKVARICVEIERRAGDPARAPARPTNL